MWATLTYLALAMLLPSPMLSLALLTPRYFQSNNYATTDAMSFSQKNSCKVFRKAKLMLEGKCHPATGLWIVPTNSEHHNVTPENPTFSSHATHNAYQTTSKAKLIQFLHQCTFSPLPSAWINAINNKHFSSWTGLTTDAVHPCTPSKAI